MVAVNIEITPRPDPDPDPDASAAVARMGFFTDTSVCIGCKACEVACKEWNGIPGKDSPGELDLTGMSFDNTSELGANSWRYVAFIEQTSPAHDGTRWLMSSDVCKHCTHAAYLDVCPTRPRARAAGRGHHGSAAAGSLRPLLGGDRGAWP